MRLSFFLTLLVATLVASYVGFTSAEDVAFVEKVDNGVRRLGGGDTIARFFSGLSDKFAKNSNTMAAGAVGAATLSDDQMVKLSKIFADSDTALNAFKVSDNEVNKMSILVKKTNAGDGVGLTDDEVAKFATAFAVAKMDAGLTNVQVFKLSKMIVNAKKVQEAAKVSDDEVAKVADMFNAVVAKKDKKSWSTLKKVIVGTLGVGVGGAVIYGVAKLTTNNSGSTTAATTTTTSSV